MVFQNFNLFPHMSVMRNITEAPVRVLGMEKAQAQSRALELLAQMGLENKKDNYPCELSGGQQQRVSIARALALSPKLMLFDEPTAGLDITAALEVQDFILKCKEQGKTIILSSHYMNEVEKLCDRVGIITRGRLADSGTIGELTEKYHKPDIEGVFLMLTSERGMEESGNEA